METVLTPPSSFRYEESSMDTTARNENWIKWKNGFIIYFKACQLNQKTQEIQINILLHVIGEQCREVINQAKTNYSTLVEVFGILDEYFKIKKNVTVERHKFFTREQIDNETIDQYIYELRKLAQSCDFSNLTEDLIKDRLICGLSNIGIRERLLREDNLTLDKAQEICRIAVVSRIYSENIKKEQHMHEVKRQGASRQENYEYNEDMQINALSRRSSGARPRQQYHRAAQGLPGPSAASAGRGARTSTNRRREDCARCGGAHGRYQCPAFGKQCLRCSKMNHFARVCGNRPQNMYCVRESEEQDGETSE